MARKLPLEGIRIVDLTIWVQGPISAAILADLGAEVIKIEKPGVGDFSRGAASMHGASLLLPDGRSSMWEQANRNKKAIAVDLYQPKGREVFYRLVERADAMVTNLHPPTLRQMAVDKETITKLHPDIIYAQSTGFGPRGPYAEDPCQDTVGMARSGYMQLSATPDGDPVYPPGAVTDVLSGTMLALGVITALLAKERDVRVPAVYTSQLSAMMWLSQFPVTVYANTGEEFPPFDRTTVTNPMMNIYKCGDAKWFASGMYVSEMFWSEFCEVMGVRELEHDPRFATAAQRAEHRTELIAILDGIFATKPRAEWEEEFRRRGMWCSVMNRISDLPADPQVEANGYLTSLDNGLTAVALPFELEGVQTRRRGAPEHGQHTDEILQEVCGYSWDEIVELKAEEIAW